MKMFLNLFLEEIPIAAFGVVAYKRFDCITANIINIIIWKILEISNTIYKQHSIRVKLRVLKYNLI